MDSFDQLIYAPIKLLRAESPKISNIVRQLEQSDFTGHLSSRSAERTYSSEAPLKGRVKPVSSALLPCKTDWLHPLQHY